MAGVSMMSTKITEDAEMEVRKQLIHMWLGDNVDNTFDNFVLAMRKQGLHQEETERGISGMKDVKVMFDTEAADMINRGCGGSYNIEDDPFAKLEARLDKLERLYNRMEILTGMVNGRIALLEKGLDDSKLSRLWKNNDPVEEYNDDE